jgi:hypothetical protein
MTYRGCPSWIVEMVKIMLVRRIGIRDVSTVLGISITKVLKVLKSGEHRIKPKRSRYDCLEIEEFWTYVGKKNGLYMRIPGKRGNRGVCMGKPGHKDSGKVEGEDKRVGDKL